ncbi:hypothetical protein SY89_02721 [Halolamina pelagica]|uniref:Uncharacterized protein n=1 Tax=Halolamina pelagica TaxID=699431 RepID=A0A0P7GD30_9EURY|nr:hypothetical protein [Halolamina pelagica]KPN31964.1 hypothetical protein SY89_02721 [Halolamina pelagica]
MEKLSLRGRLEDHLTFGAGYVPFLAIPIPVFFPFVFGLIRFQDVRAPFGPLSPSLYASITIVALIVTYLLLRQVGRWTFAPSLHCPKNILLTVGLYVGIVLAVVFIGYLITNPHPDAVTRLSLPDVLVGLTVASVYSALLSAVILRQDLAGLYGKPIDRFRSIEEWLEAVDTAANTEISGETQVSEYQKIIDEGEALLDELEGARTNEGKRLHSMFEKWLTDFRQRSSSVSRAAILTGETGNDRLLDKHQTLTCLRQQVAGIGGDEGGRI